MSRFRSGGTLRLVVVLAVVALVLVACSAAPNHSATTRTTRGVQRPAHPTTSTSTTIPAQPSLAGGATPVPVPPGPSVAPPTSIASNCTADVSAPLRAWFKSLGADQTVVMRPGACYLVDEGIKLKNPDGLIVYGGQFQNAVVPRDENGQPASDKGLPVFTVIGGSHVTFEAMQISGVNPGGYHPRLAFAGGIEFEGTTNALVHGVTIDHTFGDGITLAPLRGGADHKSGTILAPSSDITIDGVTVDGAGRQGLTFASISGAQVSDVILENIGLDTFDVEADQSNEGADNVVIDGCRASGGAIFFANGGAGSAIETRDITVAHCTMSVPQGGSAVLIVRHGGGKRGKLRGPFLFESDVFRCGASVYVGCVQITGADVTVADSRLLFPQGTVHEAVYGLEGGASAAFVEDVVKGYGREGTATPESRVDIRGGVWRPTETTANSTRTNP